MNELTDRRVVYWTNYMRQFSVFVLHRTFFFNCFFFYRAEGHPPPDTYYVDQVKNALHQIEALDIPSVWESR